MNPWKTRELQHMWHTLILYGCFISSITALYECPNPTNSCLPFPVWKDVAQAQFNDHRCMPLGTLLTYTCKDGYNFTDGALSKQSTCDAINGTWSPGFEACAQSASDDTSDPVEYKYGYVIGICFWILIGFELLLFFLLDMNQVHTFCMRLYRGATRDRRKTRAEEKPRRGYGHRGPRGITRIHARTTPQRLPKTHVTKAN